MFVSSADFYEFFQMLPCLCSSSHLNIDEKKEPIVSRPATEFIIKELIGDYLRLIKGTILEALAQARSDRGG